MRDFDRIILQRISRVYQREQEKAKEREEPLARA